MQQLNELFLTGIEKRINPKHEIRNPKQIQMTKIPMNQTKTIPHASNFFRFEF
jgi:hypothetical protein